jgi:hypothetical protein
MGKLLTGAYRNIEINQRGRLLQYQMNLMPVIFPTRKRFEHLKLWISHDAGHIMIDMITAWE